MMVDLELVFDKKKIMMRFVMMENRYPLENDWKVEEIEITLASQPGFNMLISKSSKFVIDEWT